MDTCQYCNQNAGFLRKKHGQRHDLHATGVREMVQLVAQAAGTAGFNETALRSTSGPSRPGPEPPRTRSPRLSPPAGPRASSTP